MELYEKQLEKTLGEEDKHFSKVMLQIDRLHKILSSQSSQVVSLEKKVLGKYQRDNSSIQQTSIMADTTTLKEKQSEKVVATKPKKAVDDMFQTSRLGQFPRVEDDNLSSSSLEEDKGQFDQLEEIAKIAVKHNDFSLSIDYQRQNSKNKGTINQDEALVGLLEVSDESFDDEDKDGD